MVWVSSRYLRQLHPAEPEMAAIRDGPLHNCLQWRYNHLNDIHDKLSLILKANALKQSSNCCESTWKAESSVPTVELVNLRVRKHCTFSSLTVPHILALFRTNVLLVPLVLLHVTSLQCSPFLQPHHLERAARNHPAQRVLHQLVEWFETKALLRDKIQNNF